MNARAAFVAFLVVVLGVTLGLGCAYYEDRDRYQTAQPEQITASVSYTIHGDTACAPYVRADAEQSAREWGSVSRGHIAYRLVWDLSAETLMQHREAPLILCRTRVVDRGQDVCGGITGTIIEISTAPICNPHATALHELGHLAGIASVADPTAVMNDSSLTTRLTAADVRACAAVGLCPSLRAKDVTTVTVTVDPDMPNPSLEIPP